MSPERHARSGANMEKLGLEEALQSLPSLRRSQQGDAWQQHKRRQRQRRRQPRGSVMSGRSLLVLGLIMLGLWSILPRVAAVEDSNDVTVGPLVGETDGRTPYEAQALLTNDDKEWTNDDFSAGPRRVPIAPFDLRLVSWDDIVGSDRRTALELLDVVEQVLEEFIAQRLDDSLSKTASNTTLQFVRIGKLVSFKSDPVVGSLPGSRRFRRRSLQDEFRDQGFYYETKVEVDESTASFSVFSPGDVVPSMETLAAMVHAALGRSDAELDAEEEGGRASLTAGSALLRALSLEEDFKSVAGFEYESHSFAPTLAPVRRPTVSPTVTPTLAPTTASPTLTPSVTAGVLEVPGGTVREKEIVPLEEDNTDGGGGRGVSVGLLAGVVACALLCCAFGAVSFLLFGRGRSRSSPHEPRQEQARPRDVEHGEVVKPKGPRRQLLQGDSLRKKKWPSAQSTQDDAAAGEIERKRTESASSLTTTSKDEEETGIGTPETTTSSSSSPERSNRKRPRIVPVIPMSEFVDAEGLEDEAATPPRTTDASTPATSAASSPSTIPEELEVAPSPSPTPEEEVLSMSHIESFQDRRDTMNVVLHKDMLTTHSSFPPPPPLPPPSPQSGSSTRKKPASARAKSNSFDETKSSASKSSRRGSASNPKTSRKPRRKSGTNKRPEEDEDDDTPDKYESILEPSHLTAETIAKYPHYYSHRAHVLRKIGSSGNLLLPPHQEQRTLMPNMESDVVDDSSAARRNQGVSDFQNLEFEPDSHWDPDDNDVTVTDESFNTESLFRPATDGDLRSDDGSSNQTMAPIESVRKKRTARSMSPALTRPDDSISTSPGAVDARRLRRPSLPTTHRDGDDDSSYWGDGNRLFPYLMDLVVPTRSAAEDDVRNIGDSDVVDSSSTSYSTDEEDEAAKG